MSLRTESGLLLRGNSEPKEANLHRIFGKEENVAYLDRRGAYIIPIKGEEIGVVETPKGLFLLGGGIDGDETDNQCIIRECIEEAGYQVEIKERVCSAEPVEQDHVFRWVKYEDIRGKMCLEMQNWAVEQVWNMC